MKKHVKKLASGVFIIMLISAMVFTATEIGVVINNEPVVLEALGSDGDSGGSGGSGDTYVPPAKSANPVKVKAKTYKIDYKKLVKKNQTISKNNAFSISNAKGSISFTKKSGNKKITISKKGVITVKKGLKAGKYPLKVSVKASGNSSYKAAVRTVTVTIKVITAENPIVVSGNTVTISGDALAAGNQTVAVNEAIVVKNAKGALSYKKASGPELITVDPANGNITVATGLAAGTYNIKVKVTAAGDKNYKKGFETADVDIVVTEPTPVEGAAANGGAQ